MFRERIRQVEWRPLRYERDSLTVERNGRIERYAATVVEREFLPPAWIPRGKPFIRRLLIAWREDRAFVMSSNDSVADVARFPRYTYPRPWDRLGSVVERTDDGQATWNGTNGEIRVLIGGATGSCPARDSMSRDRLDVGDEIETLVGYESCVRHRFRVSLTAQVARDDGQGRPKGIFARWLGRSESIRIPEQELPGMHIVERCVEKTWPNTNCYAFNFWRAQSQFTNTLASAIPFQLARLQPTNPSPNVRGPYQQVIAPGSGDSLVYCCRSYAGPIEYTIYGLDGTTPRHAKFNSALDDTLMDGVVGLGVVRYDSRTLYYLSWLPGSASASPVIVDLKLLPCTTVSNARRAPTQLPPRECIASKATGGR